MLVTASDSHGVKVSFQLSNDIRDHAGVGMRDFGIIYVPSDGTLLTVDVTICDAGIILRVQFETHLLQRPAGEMVPKEGRLYVSVNCLDQFHIQYFGSAFQNHKPLVQWIHFT